ncbi:hypothetical protein BC938DRAFT_483658 [Jimgerdemannia flammicorona]|uniref:Uncharacterized protein n=1 Tax=Jimgerdemannia flammicorona TaxID=994334 RepID=A0A433QBJ0_9FUNG|nr:hypothetical protein BC938DRAFT_483658 [Jimgerdemannia flammicorona]
MMQQQQKIVYSFPIMKPQDILECLNDMQIPFTEEDLSKPTSNKMQLVYEAFMDIVMGVTSEQYEQPVQRVLEELEYPDLHADAVSLMTFLRQLRKLMRDVGVEDIGLRDVIKPEPARVRKIISAIINFAKFREERMGVFEQYTTKSVGGRSHCGFGIERFIGCVMMRLMLIIFLLLLLKLVTFIGRMHGAEASLATEKSRTDRSDKCHQVGYLPRFSLSRVQRADEEPAIKKAREFNGGMTTELRELKKRQQALAEDIEQLKKVKNAQTDKMTNNQFLTMNTKQELQKLRSQIVQNPEKLKEVINEMSISLNTEKGEAVIKERSTREMQIKFDTMNIVEQEIINCVKLMEVCETEMQKFESVRDKIISDKDTIDNKNNELKELNVKEQQLKRQLATAQDKISRLQRQQAMKRESVQQKLAKLNEEFNLASNERAAVQVKIDENRRIVEELEGKIAELRANYEKEMTGIQSEYLRLKNQVDVYQNEIMQALRVTSGVMPMIH